jgi:hypothetical protein
VSWIETYTGRAFWPLDPRIEGLSIIDIAQSLANQGRYAGHAAFFYSVAQHCCLLANHVQTNGGSAEDCLEALMHDATEAYIVDVPRPLKAQWREYREWEFELEMLIREWLGLKGHMPSWVHDLDRRILMDERLHLMSRSGNDWGFGDLLPLGVGHIIPWSPEEAEKTFLTLYAAYSLKITGKHWYLNDDWEIPARVYHGAASDDYEVADVMEVDIRGGVARIKLRDSDTGILIRDKEAGSYPMPDYQWHHGRFELVTNG